MKPLTFYLKADLAFQKDLLFWEGWFLKMLIQLRWHKVATTNILDQGGLKYCIAEDWRSDVQEILLEVS